MWGLLWGFEGKNRRESHRRERPIGAGFPADIRESAGRRVFPGFYNSVAVAARHLMVLRTKKGRPRRPIGACVDSRCDADERGALTQTPGAVRPRAQFAVSHFAVYNMKGESARIKCIIK